MTPFTCLASIAAPLIRDNVDTDTIIPSREMRTTGRTGLADGLFAPLRYRDADTREEEPSFILNQPAWRGAPIILAGANFGCGSSREHAAWALADMGISAVIALSFSDIFASNAFKNGIAAIQLGAVEVGFLLRAARDNSVCVDLEQSTVSCAGRRFRFAMDPFRRQCLLEGSDEIALTLAREAAIRDYEQRVGI